MAPDWSRHALKTILITGANGFVGNHLARELAENGYRVIGIGGRLGTSEQSPYLADYRVIDLTDSVATQAIDFSEIDGVIHLAGLAAVGPSFDDPMRYVDVNVGIEVNLFETALRQAVTPRFVIISSGALYDSAAALPLTEASTVVPSSPYAVSKLRQPRLRKYYR
jgi:GDP-4-dehydro-6-deoxy-D-mannose reductase